MLHLFPRSFCFPFRKLLCELEEVLSSHLELSPLFFQMLSLQFFLTKYFTLCSDEIERKLFVRCTEKNAIKTWTKTAVTVVVSIRHTVPWLWCENTRMIVIHCRLTPITWNKFAFPALYFATVEDHRRWQWMFSTLSSDWSQVTSTYHGYVI